MLSPFLCGLKFRKQITSCLCCKNTHVSSHIRRRGLFMYYLLLTFLFLLWFHRSESENQMKFFAQKYPLFLVKLEQGESGKLVWNPLLHFVNDLMLPYHTYGSWSFSDKTRVWRAHSFSKNVFYTEVSNALVWADNREDKKHP